MSIRWACDRIRDRANSWEVWSAKPNIDEPTRYGFDYIARELRQLADHIEVSWLANGMGFSVLPALAEHLSGPTIRLDLTGDTHDPIAEEHPRDIAEQDGSVHAEA